MKKTTLTIKMELTPNQVEHWNNCLDFLKTSLSSGPRAGRQVFVQPPKEFVLKILEIPPLPVSRNKEYLEAKLFESSNPSDFWVSPFIIKELLRRER